DGPRSNLIEKMEDGRPGRPSLCTELASRPSLWQFIDLIRCHVHLNSVAEAVELPIGDGNHVAAETEKATNLDSDGGLAAGLCHYALNSSKIGPVRRLGGKSHQVTGSGWCRSLLITRHRRGRSLRRSRWCTSFRYRRCRWTCRRGCG